MQRRSNSGVCGFPDLETNEFVRSRAVVSRVAGGQTLIVPLRAEVSNLASIYSFHATGSLIWRMLETPTGLSELIAGVERENRIERNQAQEFVTQFLRDLLSVGLAEICHPEAIAAAGSKKETACQTADVG